MLKLQQFSMGQQKPGFFIILSCSRQHRTTTNSTLKVLLSLVKQNDLSGHTQTLTYVHVYESICMFFIAQWFKCHQTCDSCSSSLVFWLWNPIYLVQLFPLLTVICLFLTVFNSILLSSCLCPFVFDVPLVNCQVLSCAHVKTLQFCLLQRGFKSFVLMEIISLVLFCLSYFVFTISHCCISILLSHHVFVFIQFLFISSPLLISFQQLSETLTTLESLLSILAKLEPWFSRTIFTFLASP